MGFKDKSSKKYFNILGGRFAVRVADGTPGSEQRINKVGAEVSEIFHNSFEGKLTGITTSEHDEYGKSWNFDFIADGEEFTLKMSYSNSLAVAFLKMLPNIDVSEEFELSPSQKLVDGKNRSSLFINQGGATIKHAYTRSEPNGMPDLEEIVVSGKKTWDDTKRLAFLEAMVMSDIVPKLTKGAAQSVSDASEEEFERDVAGELGDTNDSAPSLMDSDTEGVNPEDLPF